MSTQCGKKEGEERRKETFVVVQQNWRECDVTFSFLLSFFPPSSRTASRAASSLKAKKVMLLQFPKDKWKVSYYSSLVFHQIGKWKTFFPFLVRSCSSKGSVLQLSERSFGARHASLSFRKGNEKSFLLKFASSVIDLFPPFPFPNLIMKRIPELKIPKKVLFRRTL